jgi:hypothetical protein
MTSPFDREPSALEQMLHDRKTQSPPPALRSRVLAAVDNTLPKKVPATKYGKAAQQHSPEYADLVAVTFLIGTALSLLTVAILSGDVASRRIGAAAERPLLSFAQRAEAAGITLENAPPLTVRLAAGQQDDTALPRCLHTLRPLDASSYLQGNL